MPCTPMIKHIECYQIEVTLMLALVIGGSASNVSGAVTWFVATVAGEGVIGIATMRNPVMNEIRLPLRGRFLWFVAG